MPDTAANQGAYPQSRGQKVGPGFPLCRVVGIVCLSSGAVLDAALGRFRGKGGDEQTLLRSMLDTSKAGDILIGDAYYATYFCCASCNEEVSMACSNNMALDGAARTFAWVKVSARKII